MKLFLLSPVLLAVATAQSTPGYKDICPSKDGQVGTLPNGYNFTYTCDRNGQYSARYASIDDITTVEDCASACQASTRCKGSAWHALVSKCLLFDTGEAGTVYTLQSVFLRNDNPGVGICESTDTKLAQCEGDLEESNTDLKYWTSAAAHCPNDHGSTVSSQEGDGKYKILCNTQEDIEEYAFHHLPFEECLNLCTADDACTGGVIYFPDSSNSCVLLSSVRPGGWRTNSFSIQAARQ